MGTASYIEWQNIHSREYNVSKTLQHLNKRRHLTPFLADLHCLTMYFRPQFKILVCLSIAPGLAPSYISRAWYNVLEYKLARSLLPEASSRFVPPEIRTKTYEECQLSWVAVHLWNALPDHIKQAQPLNQTSLKTL